MRPGKIDRSGLVVTGVLLGLLVGCRGERAVIGTVTFEGEPVAEGTISFEPADRNGPTTGGTITGGEFRLINEAAPLPGKQLVRINAGRKTGRQIPAGTPLPAGTMIDEIESYIPPMYNATSTLTCEIGAAAEDHVTFDLKKP
jgi:hypothetical protein